MPRTKTGTTRHKRHKKVLKLTKGFRGTNNRLYRRAHEALLHAGHYAFVGRRLRRRDLRRLWITRISAGLKLVSEDLKYSRFMNDLKKSPIALNRKMLAQLAATDFEAFKSVVNEVRK